jgi:SAM-dependent methyltransferase
MPATYDTFAPFYDLEYGHKYDDIPFYLDMARQHGACILEIGVGTGRVTIPLAQAGFSIWGIDNSIEMVQISKSKIQTLPADIHPRIHLFVDDMQSFNLKKKFSLVIIPFRTFLHNLSRQDQIATLKCIRSHLQHDGILAFDLFVPIYSVIGQRKWHETIHEDELSEQESGLTIECDITHEPEKQLLTICNSYLRKNKSRKIKNIMRYRYIFRYEMELLLNFAGFNVMDVYGGFEKQKYDYYSGLMVFTAKPN